MKDILNLWRQWKAYREKLVDINSRLIDYNMFLEAVNYGSIDSSKVNKLKEIEAELQEVFEISNVYRTITKKRPKKGATLTQIEDAFNLPSAERNVNPLSVFNRLLEKDKATIESVSSIESKLYSTKSSLSTKLISQFDSAYSALEQIAESSDIELIKQRRSALDNVFLMYFNLNGNKQPRKIRKYTHLYGERPVIIGELRRLEETYKAGKWKANDEKVLNNFIENCNNLIKRFRKIRYYEGVIETKGLQDGIYIKIGGLQKPAAKTKIYPAQQVQPVYTKLVPAPQPSSPQPQTTHIEKSPKEGDFVLQQYLSQINGPRTFELLSLGETLTDNYRYNNWYARVYQFVERLKRIGHVSNQRDIAYLRNLEHGLKQASENGLAEELNDSNRFRSKFNEALSLLCQYSDRNFVNRELILAY